MEIVRLVVQDGVDLTINGRLDSYWAEHLDHSLAEAVREGHDRLRLDLSRVTFLSSAGIAVLMKYSKQLRAIDGELVVFSPSQQVRTVLDMTRLTVHLVEAVDRTAARAARRQESVAVAREGARLEVFDLVPGAVLRGGSVAAKESGASLRCPDSLFAIGVGAIGASHTECRERFGEFLALAGAAVYLPGDGTHVPDYLVASGEEAPEVQVLRGLTGEGEFARLLRFDPAEAGAVGLAELATWCLELSGSKAAGLAIVAEVAGLVGAALRHSSAIMTGDSDSVCVPGGAEPSVLHRRARVGTDHGSRHRFRRSRSTAGTATARRDRDCVWALPRGGVLVRSAEEGPACSQAGRSGGIRAPEPPGRSPPAQRRSSGRSRSIGARSRCLLVRPPAVGS